MINRIIPLGAEVLEFFNLAPIQGEGQINKNSRELNPKGANPEEFYKKTHRNYHLISWGNQDNYVLFS